MYGNTTDIMLWFDLDDTVWDMTGNSALCLRELYDNLGLQRYFASPEEWDEVYHSINHTLWDEYGRGDITRDYLRSERFARPLRLAGIDADKAAKMSVEMDRLYLDSLGRKTAVIPGARETLDYLRSHGYRMGIVSNGFREVQYNKLRSAGIDSFFDPVILSDDAGVNKPAPAFFRYAEEKAGTAAMHNIIIGDNVKADIIGALDAGWDAIWYNPDGDPTPAEETRKIVILRRLTELTDLF